jgi:hypothetical protein
VKVRPPQAEKMRVSRGKSSWRVLPDLSAPFANVAVDQVVAEIEGALAQLLNFLALTAVPLPRSSTATSNPFYARRPRKA